MKPKTERVGNSGLTLQASMEKENRHRRVDLRRREKLKKQERNATDMLRVLSPVLVAQRLGHSKVSITQDVYGNHVPDDVFDDSTKLIDSFFSSGLKDSGEKRPSPEPTKEESDAHTSENLTEDDIKKKKLQDEIARLQKELQSMNI